MVKIERESINFKLPKSLCDALRAVAEQRNTTATDLVIQGLHHILGDVPGVEASVEVRLDQLEEEFWRIKQSINLTSTNPHQESRLTALENKLEAMSTRLAQFEGVITQLQYSVNSSKSRKSRYPNAPFIFMSSRKSPLAPDSIRGIIEQAGKLADLPFPIHAHMLRHACGYYLAREKKDTRTIQGYLGHKNIQHTVRYTQLSPQPYKGLWKKA